MGLLFRSTRVAGTVELEITVFVSGGSTTDRSGNDDREMKRLLLLEGDGGFVLIGDFFGSTRSRVAKQTRRSDR